LFGSRNGDVLRTVLVHIRPATDDDIAFLTEVAVSTVKDQGRWPADEDEAEYRIGYAEWTREQIRGGEPCSSLSVLEVNGVRVGRLRVVRPGNLVEIAGIQVMPTFQGQGIGTQVMRALIAEARVASLPLELGVETNNPRARALYDHLGLRPVAHDGDETRMRLDPPSPDFT
jgi:ribosomal protein S18 acetylase RimI-like enzyme